MAPAADPFFWSLVAAMIQVPQDRFLSLDEIAILLRNHGARVAVMRNPASKQRSARRRAKGHSHRRALRGVMDRLRTVAVAMLRSGTAYQPEQRCQARRVASRSGHPRLRNPDSPPQRVASHFVGQYGFLWYVALLQEII
jgi:hypothetical protein